MGVWGHSGTSYGVIGQSETGSGVLGHIQSSDGDVYGALGHYPSSSGVYGYTPSRTAVYGYSGPGSSVPTPANTGVFGFADRDKTSVGLRGESPAGRGGVFKGNLAQVKLTPSSATSHPHSGQRGDLFVDQSGRLWFCKGGTTWKQIA